MRMLKKTSTGALAIAAAVAMVFGTSFATHAAYENVRPGAGSPVGITSNSSWLKMPSESDRIAQPFVQPETGNIISFTIEVNGQEDVPYDFSSAAIHEFSEGVGPASTPLAGGLATITFSAPSDSTGIVKALLTFDEKPLLTEGSSYALVINPATDSEPMKNASFPTYLQWSNANPELFIWNTTDGAWAAYATAFTIFESQLGTYVEDSETLTPPTVPTPPKRVETGA